MKDFIKLFLVSLFIGGTTILLSPQKALAQVSVVITDPLDGQILPYNNVPLIAEVTTDTEADTVGSVGFYLNEQLYATDYIYPFEVSWYFTDQVPGSFYTIKAVAYTADYSAVSSPVTVQIAPDLIPPSGAIVSPANGSIIPSRSLVLIRERAIDNYQIRNVEFFVDGAKICNVSEPFTGDYYECLWETPRRKNVTYTLSTRVFDVFGNYSTYSITVKSH